MRMMYDAARRFLPDSARRVMRIGRVPKKTTTTIRAEGEILPLVRARVSPIVRPQYNISKGHVSRRVEIFIGSRAARSLDEHADPVKLLFPGERGGWGGGRVGRRAIRGFPFTRLNLFRATHTLNLESLSDFHIKITQI